MPDGVAYIFNSSLQKAEADLCEIKVSLVYIWSFRLVKGYIVKPCLKTPKQKQR